MAKIGRNDACPCGSGKKYKRCCSERDRLKVVSDRQLAEQARVVTMRDVARAMAEKAQGDLDETAGLTEEVQELIDAGRFDEAEEISRKLEADFPDEPTLGIERLAQVYAARGAGEAAADHYRRGVAMMDAAGRGHYCDCCRARMVKEIRRLDPEGVSPALGLDPQ